MYSRAWSTSERRFDVTVDRDVKVPMADGTLLAGDVYRPSARGRYPVILSVSPYSKDLQSPPMRPIGFHPMVAWMEAGDPTYFVRRGYVHAIFNVRGAGDSHGYFRFCDPVEVEDAASLVNFVSDQSWSDGNVGMFGVSYFAKIAKAVAAYGAPALKVIFAPWSSNDRYRHVYYHGGILSARFASHWRFSPHNLKYRSLMRMQLGDEEYGRRLEELTQDMEIMAHPLLPDVLADPTPPRNQMLIDVLMNPLDGPYWQERHLNGEIGDVPAYFGADWGNYAIHLGGAFSAYTDWRGFRTLVIGPGVYLDRPVYQTQAEALRWFDQFLLGKDMGILKDPPVRCFMPTSGEWSILDDWPPPDARWLPLFLHEGERLSPDENSGGADTMSDSSSDRGELVYTTSPVSEATDVLGPPVATLYVSTTDTECLLFLTLLVIHADGKRTELTRGWLRSSQRALDDARSAEWEPVLRHSAREPLERGTVYRLRVPIVATARQLQPGEQIALRIKVSDEEPAATALEAVARGHLARPGPATITLHHGEEYPSRLDLPVTRGGFSGGYSVSTGARR